MIPTQGPPMPQQPRSARPCRAPQEHDAGGHIMVLLIGYVLLALLVVTVVAAVCSIYLGQKKLLSMADSAALAAADTFELTGGSTSSEPGTLLTSHGVRAAALNYLASIPAPDSISNIEVDLATGAGDGRTAYVSITGVVHPMFINFLVPDGVTITVTSTARAKLLL